jgi:hypothetical protein
VHLGAVEDGEIFVDLEALGTFAVVSPFATELLRSMAASLAVSPFMDAARVITVGLGDWELGDGNIVSAVDITLAIASASLAVGSTTVLARDVTTFALRATGAGGEAWEPAVVIAAGECGDDQRLAELLGDVSIGRGLAVVVDADTLAASFSLRFDGSTHVLEPLGLRVHPAGLEQDDVRAVADLVRAAEAPLEIHAPVLHLDLATRPVVSFAEPEWSLLVRVLGQVEVVAADGSPAAFVRSKALELVVWLSQHPERPTRSAARAALWELDVRDATFSNVVSDARRAMGRAVAPSHGEEWIARTLTDDLPLHKGVVTDAELLTARVRAARGLAAVDAIEVLRPGLDLVTAMPFAGTSYLWTDAEGHSSSLVLLATGAAIELATHYLTLGDVDGVFWATGQGLKVLNGHEELIALRMRAHARRGDLAGVRNEWESYERALAVDTWAAAEPAPKLVDLRRALLSPSHRAEAEGA